MFVSRDVVFEEGQPHRTSPNMGEPISLFDTLDNNSGGRTTNDANEYQDAPENNEMSDNAGSLSTGGPLSHKNNSAIPPASIPHEDNLAIPSTSIPATATSEPCRSTRVPLPSNAILNSRDYQQ